MRPIALAVALVLLGCDSGLPPECIPVEPPKTCVRSGETVTCRFSLVAVPEWCLEAHQATGNE